MITVVPKLVAEPVIPVDLACMISAKNLGDAVGHAESLAELAKRGYANRFLVWTKPESAFLFNGIRNCNVITSPLPLGTGRKFSVHDIPAVLRAARAIRSQRPSVTLDLVGDVRERWLARLAGSPRHLHIGWAAEHPFNRLIRNPFGHGHPVITIPATTRNVYDSYRMFLDALIAVPVVQEADTSDKANPALRRELLRIGLHPYASQECKLWPFDKWRQLIDALLDRGHALTAFCAPSELGRLQIDFGDALSRIKVFAKTLHELDSEVGSLDVMIGLDSFSVHLAHRHSVHSVMLNAGNPPGLWTPPGGVALGTGSGCPKYPCFNVPACVEKSRFICVRNIEVEDVLASISNQCLQQP